jgi:hypothetical protein
MQNKNKTIVSVPDTSGEDDHAFVKSLQAKLDDAVSRVSELTEVLGYLGPEYTTEYYYEESAKRAMEPLLAAANSGYPVAGGNASVGYSKG